ncbi:hypothetical protein CAter282_3765 [Collimonas arenae]|uniref:Uncharacterized protein n=1 Tax=Collimonas arenae TaxID=279058 RepID=A0A127QN15_9BURK|nr:hypothetical protein CAter282_3765 [Collimonas arenae]
MKANLLDLGYNERVKFTISPSIDFIRHLAQTAMSILIFA